MHLARSRQVLHPLLVPCPPAQDRSQHFTNMLPSRLSLCALRGSKSWAGSTTPGLTGLLNLRPSFSATTLDSCPAATYSSNSKPDPKLEASEREVKLGANVPESIHHAASETVAAAGGLASSIATAVSSTVTASKRAIGLTDAKPLSKGDIHGGGGTMEYTPSWSTSGSVMHTTALIFSVAIALCAYLNKDSECYHVSYCQGSSR